ncbi:hypothetical protein [Actinoallomurus acanthiterrae]
MPNSPIRHGASRPWTGALSGLCHVLLFLASLALPGILGQQGGAGIVTPYSTDAEVAHFLSTAPRDVLPVAAFCQAMSALALLLFAARVPDHLRRIDPQSPQAGAARTVGTVAAALLLLSACAQWVLNRPGTGSDLHVYRAVMDLTFITGAGPQVATTGLLFGAVAVAARTTRLLPGWLCWIGIVVAVISALSMLSLLGKAATPLIPIGRFSGMLWLLGASIVLLRRRAAVSGRASVVEEPV